jgi:hypothetical protein
MRFVGMRFFVWWTAEVLHADLSKTSEVVLYMHTRATEQRGERGEREGGREG